MKPNTEEKWAVHNNAVARTCWAADVELVAATCRTCAGLLRNFKRVLFRACRISAASFWNFKCTTFAVCRRSASFCATCRHTETQFISVKHLKLSYLERGSHYSFTLDTCECLVSVRVWSWLVHATNICTINKKDIRLGNDFEWSAILKRTRCFLRYSCVYLSGSPCHPGHNSLAHICWFSSELQARSFYRL